MYWGLGEGARVVSAWIAIDDGALRVRMKPHGANTASRALVSARTIQTSSYQGLTAELAQIACRLLTQQLDHP